MCRTSRLTKKLKHEKLSTRSYKSIGGTPHLDQNYTVFGEIIEGMEVIDLLAAVKKGAGDVPVEPLIFSIKTLKK